MRPWIWLAALAILAGSTGDAADPPTADPGEPLPSGLVETEERRLVQIEVTVHGPPDVIPHLTPDDFKLKIKAHVVGPWGLTERKIDEFYLDIHCADPSPPVPLDEALDDAARASSESVPATERAALPPRPVSYVIYFDQNHLTIMGRARAMDLVRDLIPEIVHGNNRAMIVSNARRLEIVQELTSDADLLLSSIDRLEGDFDQWSSYAEEEFTRVAQLLERIELGPGIQRAASLARQFQREEVFRADKDMRRLTMTLNRIAELETFKAVIYLSDIMRQNAGEHYSRFFGVGVRNTLADSLSMDYIMAEPAFDQLVNSAASRGIRFYAIQAQGLVGRFDRPSMTYKANRSIETMGQAIGSTEQTSWIRQGHAELTLRNMASETGGAAFVRGETATKIARRIQSDFSCIYLVSFDAQDLRENAALGVKLKSLRPDVRVHTRGRLVVPSKERLLTTRLLGAFLVGGGSETELELRTQLIPTGFDDGSYTALLQLSIPGSSLHEAVWDVGASMVFRESVHEEVSGTLQVSPEGTPVVFEREVKLRPGSQEIFAVAHETMSDVLLSDRIEVDWPDPNRSAATLSPVLALQPTRAAFDRAGEVRGSGSLAVVELRPGLPTALMGLVCRGRKPERTLTVERRLVGPLGIDFDPMLVTLADERCVQFRDLIPADALPPGPYRYEVRVKDRNDKLAREAGCDLRVTAPGAS